jgi:hypothetical protein
MNFGVAKPEWKTLQYSSEILHDLARVHVPTAIVAHRRQIGCNQAGTLLERIERLYMGFLSIKTSACAKRTHPRKTRISAIRGTDLCTSRIDEDLKECEGEERIEHHAGPNGQLGGKQPSTRQCPFKSRSMIAPLMAQRSRWLGWAMS